MTSEALNAKIKKINVLIGEKITIKNQSNPFLCFNFCGFHHIFIYIKSLPRQWKMQMCVKISEMLEIPNISSQIVCYQRA